MPVQGRKDRACRVGRNERTCGSGRLASFRNVVPLTARRAIARARIASATASASTAYCESLTSCRSSCICRCIEVTEIYIGQRALGVQRLWFDPTSV